MINQELRTKYQFLYEQGQAIIKNEAAHFLGLKTDELRLQMVKSPEVQYWIGCLHHFVIKPQVHNAADTCFENAMHKLLSYGIREADDQRIKEVNRFIVELLSSNTGNESFFNSVNTTILASWLAYMGYSESIVIEILRERVDTVYSFTRQCDYDIYIDPRGFPSIPKARAMHPFVKPELYAGNVWRLPTIHDVFAYANLPEIMHGEEGLQHKIDTILEYIMDERYQKLYRGYGLMLVPPRIYYSMGWSVHLSRYSEDSPIGSNEIVWQMELMSHFEKARDTAWFQNNLMHLKSFERDGICEFPTEYLQEARNKYYVNGCHMGLGEDRKRKLSKKIESTAWMLRIRKNCMDNPPIVTRVAPADKLART